MSTLRSFRDGMEDFAQCIQALVNSTLLAFVYLIGVGATAVYAKIKGKRFLEKENKERSYWKELALKRSKREDYYRQF